MSLHRRTASQGLTVAERVDPASSTSNIPPYHNHNHTLSSPRPPIIRSNSDASTAALSCSLSATDTTGGTPTRTNSDTLVRTPRRRALLVGISYHNTTRSILGVQRDLDNVYALLHNMYPTDDAEIRILADVVAANRTPEQIEAPTRANILEALAWLVDDALPGDKIILHLSGHGTRILSNERASKSPAIVGFLPMDHEEAGPITDVEFYDTIVAPLPRRCRLVAILDCCHAAGLLRLPFRPRLPSLSRNPLRPMFTSLRHLFAPQTGQDAPSPTKTAASVIVVAAFGSRQDCLRKAHMLGHGSPGSVSWYLREMLETTGGTATWGDLLKGLTDLVRSRYPQKPGIASGRNLRLNKVIQL